MRQDYLRISEKRENDEVRSVTRECKIAPRLVGIAEHSPAF